MKIHSAEIVVFDVETTGLFPQDGDRIVEIAAMKVKGGKVVDQFYSLVNPKRPIPPEATNINQITEDMVADAPTADAVLPNLIDFISGGCVAGHNARFDMGFLCYELSLFGRRLKDDTPVVDTLKMAKGLLPYLSSYKLSYLARSLGVTVTQTHRAMADVELTVAVLLRMMEMAADKNADDVGTFLTKFGVEKPLFKLVQVAQDSLF
ncbi:MAG TPA: 3'-5' exonuclease [Candidatus Omnitrophota bacterium]|nr:3'-5' exonuclease [Candidatus Omnitrophota bacterium]